MINLGWNTTGRIGLADYNKARWRHFAFCLIPVALYIGAGAGASQLPLWAPVTLVSIATVLFLYYRYRFLQVMVRRMHDRNMSGKLLILSPLLLFLFVVIGFGFIVTAAVGDAGAPAWLSSRGGFISLAVAVPFFLFNLFLRFQLSQAGTPGPNLYGPPPGGGQARVF